MTKLEQVVVTIAMTACILCTAVSASVVPTRQLHQLRPRATSTPALATFANVGAAAYATLNADYYSPGQWSVCMPATCGVDFHDWGADDMMYDVWLHWKLTHDTSVGASLNAISNNLPWYNYTCASGCTQWSDVPMWDSVAQSRVYNVTSNAMALSKAANAFAFVDQAPSFALGACPTIDFQHPSTSTSTGLKTLETDANYIKAALLLYRYTSNPAYLTKAEAKYAAVNQYFLDPQVPLYSVYVVDNGPGQTCAQIPHRFFASVNGIMIFNGLELAKKTGVASYYTNALATAQAVAADLNDGAGNYANLQAENDVAEPLIEAMYDLATEHRQVFARNWLVRNAANLTPASTGAYGRFINGPANLAATTVWQTNGGIALAMAAAALAPNSTTAPYWSNASYVADNISGTPATVTFTGQAIALIGTIGEQCCESGHARVFVDGVETFDGTGIWQNKSSSNHSLPGSVLFAWRFAQGGQHTITIQPGIYNIKEGASFFHMVGYDYVP